MRNAQLAATAASSTSKQQEVKASKEDVPSSFGGGKRELRDYQRDGVRWLRYNYTQGRSVILGDEMGLGKTAQSVSMLHCVRNLHKAQGPFLIVVPLAVLPHWQREVEAWTNLHPVVFHGNEQARATILDYEWATEPRGSGGTGRFAKGWGRDTLRHPKFDVSPRTKSSSRAPSTFARWTTGPTSSLTRCIGSRTSSAGPSRRSRRSALPTLALTGTPLQNNVGELWTILNLLDEAAFPSSDDFLDKFGDMTSASQVQALTDALRPYLLRRTKQDVDLGITPMEETLVNVEITNYQKQTYKALLEQNRTLLLRGATAVQGPSFNNLAMQLRHCCNHPFLIKGVVRPSCTSPMTRPTSRLVASSGKLVLLDKLLPKLKAQGHRVLLFSQFTMLLDLLEDYIRLSGYSYERRRGVTGNARQAAIDRYSSRARPPSSSSSARARAAWASTSSPPTRSSSTTPTGTRRTTCRHRRAAIVLGRPRWSPCTGSSRVARTSTRCTSAPTRSSASSRPSSAVTTTPPPTPPTGARRARRERRRPQTRRRRRRARPRRLNLCSSTARRISSPMSTTRASRPSPRSRSIRFSRDAPPRARIRMMPRGGSSPFRRAAPLRRRRSCLRTARRHPLTWTIPTFGARCWGRRRATARDLTTRWVVERSLQ